MLVITEKGEMREWSREQRKQGHTIAFVPTMGSLHRGHMGLVDLAKQQSDKVAVSIYINPTQFAAHEDFDTYPKSAAEDRRLLEEAGVAVCFQPANLYAASASAMQPVSQANAAKEDAAPPRLQQEAGYVKSNAEEAQRAALHGEQAAQTGKQQEDSSPRAGKVDGYVKSNAQAAQVQALHGEQQPPHNVESRAPCDGTSTAGNQQHQSNADKRRSSPAAQPPHDVYVVPKELAKPLCGASRPHFFRGVATVVAKLFNIVEPDVAVFGKKDYQQLVVIRALARDLDFQIEIVGGAIARESDGLACSSRNAQLTTAARAAAPTIRRALLRAHNTWQHSADVSVQTITETVASEIRGASGRIDYVEVVHADTLQPVLSVGQQAAVLAVAAWFEGVDGQDVRLIDNIALHGSAED